MIPINSNSPKEDFNFSMKLKLFLLSLLFIPFTLQAQTVKQLSLQEAVDLGVANSKNLKLSQQN